MKLQEIGFYTLSDERAANISDSSPIYRAEMILTNRCNFSCPYCRGLKVLSEDCTKDMSIDLAKYTLQQWISQGLKNVRFSGGEPTLYPHLIELVKIAKYGNVEHIAISTNGSNDLEVYKQLIKEGVNDFSISLDACCATFGDKMAGVPGYFDKVISNIRELSKLTYVTVGVVVTPETVQSLKETIYFAHNLGVADIRIISSAQWDQILEGLEDIEQSVLDAHPILKYRVRNFKDGKNVRGISRTDCRKCHLVKDDSVVAGRWHFPCVIYMREGGKSIGEVGPNMREERIKWFEKHDSFQDKICRKNCLDVCQEFNFRVEVFQNGHL